MRFLVYSLSIICVCIDLSFEVNAQDNYEIQVYGAETVPQGSTMLELHSNITLGGQQYMQEGVLPTQNMVHETIEITHGFLPWFECGFYLFNAIGDQNRTTYVGSHVRPRVNVPQSWHWPVGASLSAEVGYQKPEYSADDWTLEIRPIVDKTWKKWYVAINPVFDQSLHGYNQNRGYSFSPNVKGSYKITKKVAAGLEYYGTVNKLDNFGPVQEQQHQLFAAVDIDFAEDWEFNAGYGLGFTASTDNDIFKMIIGYRLHRKEGQKQPGRFEQLINKYNFLRN